MKYYHVDVFSSQALSGNGLTVIFHEDELSVQTMQRLAQEFKQFETIFLRQTGERSFRARIFTVEEELDFAGHPILGAVSTIHQDIFPREGSISVQLELNHKIVQADSARKMDYYEAIMNQGTPYYLGTVDESAAPELLAALNLSPSHRYPGLPLEVISTGLPYLIIPLASGLEQAAIVVDDLEERLGKVQAKFVYVLDVANKEGRTWDNLGQVEDVATGSAAGPAGAYLQKWKRCDPSERIILEQGRFVGRPSLLYVHTDASTGDVYVSGEVKMLVRGEFL
ncbi:PhzF family phenazine biosynthesis protein [Paenibacillus sp. SYP-B4298]|uniref:PhzF family phenazine biosynthesis protein n=1 Tax=Paenibacillus sp. SYP-B4298 TaxID=2996034 RepID=UPI0022DDB7A2|nr:PhzF family phenazine biosynthesis protein [Paenibacillus sp. SYP-B4298]